MSLETMCWCQDKIVMVPSEMVKQGLTYPCRRPRCQTISEQNGVIAPKRKGRNANMGMPQMWWKA